MVEFIASCVHPILCLTGHQPVICVNRGLLLIAIICIQRTHHWHSASLFECPCVILEVAGRQLQSGISPFLLYVCMFVWLWGGGSLLNSSGSTEKQ